MSVVGVSSPVDTKRRSFVDTVAFYQHQAIERGLSELLSVNFDDDCTDVSHCSSLSSMSPKSSRANTLDVVKFCQVQFKHVFRHFRLPLSMNDIHVGEFVIVESLFDKTQEDLGVVTFIYNEEEFEFKKELKGPSDDTDENLVGRVLRIASSDERKVLPWKFQREFPLLRRCQNFVEECFLPMTVYGVEYQFDGSVLFVYYLSQYRVDFRPLVKYLTKYCKGTRIQMKKTNQCRMFVPIPAAAEALVTGKHCWV